MLAELRREGFEKPTPLQVQAWPIVLQGYDFVGIVEKCSCRGKTIAYMLPMLVHVMAQPELKPGEGPTGLVLLPTHEHCMQVTAQAQAFTTRAGLVCDTLVDGGDENELLHVGVHNRR